MKTWRLQARQHSNVKGASHTRRFKRDNTPNYHQGYSTLPVPPNNMVNIHSMLTSYPIRSLVTRMARNRKFVYARRFEGLPKVSDFRLEESEVPALQDNEIHTEALYLSVDPYMRVMASRIEVGSLMFGSQVARVVESKHADYKQGDIVVGEFGWQTHFVGNPDEIYIVYGNKVKPTVVPKSMKDMLSHALGALGMPGNTAYFGFLEICQPKEGETVVVSGAAGAVGSLVGQIARIKGCRVIGLAGSEEKVALLKKELRFDEALNYKKGSVGEALRAAAPQGVDCYFDNVGGELSSQVMAEMRPFGRVSVCGSISAYNHDLTAQLPKAPILQPAIVMKQLKVEGFIVSRWTDRWMEGIHQMAAWMARGKIKAKETVVEGFENTPSAFISLLSGGNTGKIIVKI